MCIIKEVNLLPGTAGTQEDDLGEIVIHATQLLVIGGFAGGCNRGDIGGGTGSSGHGDISEKVFMWR